MLIDGTTKGLPDQSRIPKDRDELTDVCFRVCVWEGHKNPNVFPDPFRFDPERFVGHAYSLEEYAPFGMDKRHCIASDFVVTLSAMFIETLLERFVVTLASDGPPKLAPITGSRTPIFRLPSVVLNSAEGAMLRPFVSTPPYTNTYEAIVAKSTHPVDQHLRSLNSFHSDCNMSW